MGGVEQLGQHAAAEPARGLGEEPGRGQEAGGDVHRHLLALGEELQHRRAQVRQQIGPAREQVAEFAQVPGGLVGVGRARGAQLVDQCGPQPDRILVRLAQFEQFSIRFPCSVSASRLHQGATVAR